MDDGTIKCRAQISPACYHGRYERAVYGDLDMGEDGSFDGSTVICDACYLALGQPSVPVGAGRQAALEHMDAALAEFKARLG